MFRKKTYSEQMSEDRATWGTCSDDLHKLTNIELIMVALAAVCRVTSSADFIAQELENRVRKAGS